MLGNIIKKEIRDVLTSPKFLFTFLVCAILILLSVYSGVTNYRAEMREYATSVALNEKNIAVLTSYNALVQHIIRVSKPPQVLGMVVGGVEEAVGRVAPISPSTDPSLVDSKYDSNPVFAVFGALDLMFIVKMVLSLFAILFTYDAIVGEKEKGTLKLALSNSVPRDQLILGKAIGGYVCLLIPLLIPMMASLIIMLIAPDIALSGTDWLRLLLIFLMFFLYLSVFFSLGLFVSARTSRSSTSFLILLFIWVILVMVIPKVAVLAAAHLKPISSIHEVTAKKDAFLQQAQVEIRDANIKWSREHAGDNDKDYEDNFKKQLEDSARDFAAKIDSFNASTDLDYQVRKNAQQSLAVDLSRISPASALSFGTMALARTGIDEFDRFLSSVRSYKRQYTEWLILKGRQGINLKTGETPKIDLKDMPKHRMEPERLGESLARTLPDFGLMLVMIVVFFGGAYISFRRYDVR